MHELCADVQIPNLESPAEQFVRREPLGLNPLGQERLTAAPRDCEKLLLGGGELGNASSGYASQ